MRAYLAALRDEMICEKPFTAGEDTDLLLWQVLLHVVNHGTDHRAQLRRMVHDRGVKTGPQEFIFYVYDNGELYGYRNTATSSSALCAEMPY